MIAVESSHTITHDESHSLILLALFFFIFKHMIQSTLTLHVCLYSITFVIMRTLKTKFFEHN